MLPQSLAPATCANCGAPLPGRYCSACGEESLTPESRTVRHFVTTSLLDEVVHFDSRFWRTIRMLLVRPGQLTTEFIAGRRRHYVGPVKLLLASIFAFVVATSRGFVAALMIGPIALSIAPTAPPRGATVRESVQMIDRFGILDGALTRKAGPGDGPAGAAQDQFQDRITRFAQPLAFGNVFFLAAGLFWMFRRTAPLYLDHLVFAMHVQAFVLLSSLLLVPAFQFEETAPWIATAMALAVLGWQFGYLSAAIRRTYIATSTPVRRARLRAAGVAIVLYLLNGIFVTVVQLIAGAIAIRQM